jgi:hypothetical protein
VVLRERAEEFVEVLGEELRIGIAGAVFENEGDTTGATQAGDGWRSEAERDALLDAAERS